MTPALSQGSSPASTGRFTVRQSQSGFPVFGRAFFISRGGAPAVTARRARGTAHVGTSYYARCAAGRGAESAARRPCHYFSACIFREMVFIIAMLIWILALLVVASGFGLGLRLGSITAAFSFVAIFIAYLFAHLVGRLFKPLLVHVFAPGPVIVWAVPTIVGFCIVYALIVAGGFEVQRRVGVYYKYKVGDLQRGLWERLDNRLGGCVGILNGTAWLVLVSFVLFNWSYWTTQIAPSENEPKITRLANNLGYGMQSTGLDKAARAVGSIPESFYRMADFAGLLVQNPRIAGRLGDYPAFISLAERPEIQSLVQDSSLVSSWDSRAPMSQILNDGQVQSIIKNTNVSATVWNTVQANIDDITNFLLTGKSPKYDSEKIIGRWQFDVVPALGALLEANPKIKPNDLKAIRALWNQAFAQTTFVAGSDGQAFLKSVPDFKKNPPDSDTWTGQWSSDGTGTNYVLNVNANNQSKTAMAQTDGVRLTVKLDNNTLVFQRTY